MLIICSREKSKGVISVSVQNVCPLNCTCVHIESNVFEKKNFFVAGIGIFQEKWATSIVADALAPRIVSSPVAMVLTKYHKRPIHCVKLPSCVHMIVA